MSVKNNRHSGAHAARRGGHEKKSRTPKREAAAPEGYPEERTVPEEAYAEEDYVPEERYAEEDYLPEEIYPQEGYVPEEVYAEEDYAPEEAYAEEGYLPEEAYVEEDYTEEEYGEEAYPYEEYEETAAPEGYEGYPDDLPAREPPPEEPPAGRGKALRRSLPFFLAFTALTVFAWMLPLRPSYSTMERRELEKFPEFSVSSLFSGDWFEGISLWFSDTFPGREGWVQANSRFQALYGIQGVTISGSMVTSDVVEEEKDMTDVAAATPAPLPVVSQSTPAPAATPSPTPDPEDGVEFNATDAVQLNAYIFGDAGYERYGLGKGNAELYGKILGRAATRYAEAGRRLFSVICPNSGGIMLSLETYDQLYNIRQNTAIDYFYTSAGEDLIPVKIYDTLRSHNQEYLYFRTDHHWTALGAWYAYEEFCRQAGFEPVTLDNYTMQEFPGFLGSYYKSAVGSSMGAKNAALMADNPDTVYAFCPPGNITCRAQNGGDWQEIPLLSDMSAENADRKYLTFLRGGEQYQVIMENEDIDDDSACLLIKDSYGNPFALYLTQHYHTVVMMNFRNQFEVHKVLKQFDIDDIIVLTELVMAQDTDVLGRFGSDFLY